jgi:hypothetical protein
LFGMFFKYRVVARFAAAKNCYCFYTHAIKI